eukprot:GHVQ01022820.1.p1 GENE.GHVQ01022820.1~~GHVQ01022820.1.p1  ORF type:complete len:555 (+),score=100.57 GHVQ01022820.1:236-1900(+)
MMTTTSLTHPKMPHPLSLLSKPPPLCPYSSLTSAPNTPSTTTPDTPALPCVLFSSPSLSPSNPPLLSSSPSSTAITSVHAKRFASTIPPPPPPIPSDSPSSTSSTYFSQFPSAYFCSPTSSASAPPLSPTASSSSTQSPGSSRTTPDLVRRQLFKTKHCPHHYIGKCYKGTDCTFAHSPDEIRPLPDLRNTRLCLNVRHGGNCTDPSCMFAHCRSDLRTTDSRLYKVRLCNFNKKGKCLNREHCRFAHGTAELRGSLQSKQCSSSAKAVSKDPLPPPVAPCKKTNEFPTALPIVASKARSNTTDLPHALSVESSHNQSLAFGCSSSSHSQCSVSTISNSSSISSPCTPLSTSPSSSTLTPSTIILSLPSSAPAVPTTLPPPQPFAASSSSDSSHRSLLYPFYPMPAYTSSDHHHHRYSSPRRRIGCSSASPESASPAGSPSHYLPAHLISPPKGDVTTHLTTSSYTSMQPCVPPSRSTVREFNLNVCNNDSVPPSLHILGGTLSDPPSPSVHLCNSVLTSDTGRTDSLQEADWNPCSDGWLFGFEGGLGRLQLQ